MKGSDFRGGSYIDSPDWMKDKNTINNIIKKVINVFNTL